MTKFLNTSICDAEPMTRGEYNIFRGWKIPPDENPADLGYLKTDKAGNYQWDPADKFEACNMPLLSKGTTICLEDVDNFIGSTSVNTLKIGGVPKTTLVTAVLINGFVIHETSSCVDPKNYDEQVGADICMGKIKDQIWKMLGFLLQSGMMGFKPVVEKLAEPAPAEPVAPKSEEPAPAPMPYCQSDLGISPIMKHFEYDHLPPTLKSVSKPLCEMARLYDQQIPADAEKSAGLRKLLEAKDCFVRASR